MSTNKVAPAATHELQKEGSNIQTQPSKFHKVIQSISNVLFSMVASITTFGFGFLLGLVWILIMSITCFYFPPTKILWNYKEIHGTWMKSFGDVVYERKTNWWLDNHALCPDESDWVNSNLTTVYPSHTTPFEFAHSSVKAHVRVSSCSSDFHIPDDDSSAPVIVAVLKSLPPSLQSSSLEDFLSSSSSLGFDDDNRRLRGERYKADIFGDIRARAINDSARYFNFFNS